MDMSIGGCIKCGEPLHYKYPCKCKRELEEGDDYSDPITERELTAHAILKCRELWDIDFDIPIVFVNREWKRKGASIRVDTSSVPLHPIEIRFSKPLVKKWSREKTYKLLLHELVHWYLIKTRQPFEDDHEVFIRECLKVNAPLSKSNKVKEAVKRLGIEYSYS
jgi:hypothetical protein